MSKQVKVLKGAWAGFEGPLVKEEPNYVTGKLTWKGEEYEVRTRRTSVEISDKPDEAVEGQPAEEKEPEQWEKVVAWLCDDCEHIDTEASDNPVYECSSCGAKFTKNEADGHRCPECGKFGTKLSANACSECDGTTEEVEAWKHLPCGEVMLEDEKEKHLEECTEIEHDDEGDPELEEQSA